jgi:hypothetical protein
MIQLAAPFGKWPGQSATTCSSVRDIPLASSPFAVPQTRAVARLGFSLSSCFRASRSPFRIA